MRIESVYTSKTRGVLLFLIGALLMMPGQRVGNVAAGAARLEAAGESESRRLPRPDHVLRSTPANVVWGEFPSDRPPVLVVESGDVVRIETLSHAGATQGAT